MKRILSVLLALVMIVGMIPMSILSASAADTTEVVFNLGANGSASHADGNSKTTYSETVDGYTLDITGGTKMYTGARDAQGNSCIKLGTSSAVGGFTFTVPKDVTSVVICIAKYKNNTTKVNIGGTAYTLSNTSNNGAYDEITVDTSANKTVKVTTVSGGVRAMVNTIKFIVGGAVACEHTNQTTTTVDATCVDAGSKTTVCDDCGATVSEETIDALGHTYVDSICSVCGYTTVLTKYELVTNVASLSADDKIIIVGSNSDKYYAILPYVSGNNAKTATVDAPVDNVITLTAECEAARITLGGDSAGWTLYDGAKYYNAPGGTSDNHLKGVATLPENNTAAWTISIDSDGVATIVNVGNSGSDARNTIKFNYSDETNYLFSCYKASYTSKVALVSIYREVKEGAEACQHVNTTEIAEIPATCGKPGITAGVKCDDCGDIISGCEEIPATGEHNFVDYLCVTCGAFTQPEANSTLTIPVAVAIGLSKEHNTYTADMYYVTGVVEKIEHETYGNMYIQDEAGNRILIYGVYSADGTTRYDAMEVKPVVGDTVTLYGIIGNYSGTAQMKNGWLTAHTSSVVCEHTNKTTTTVDATCGVAGSTTVTCDDCGETISTTEIPATGEHNYVDGVCGTCGKNENEVEATITFDDKAKRTEYTNDIQVWEENGITVTNEKAASSSNVGDYSNPARFYKGSKLTIAYPNMSKIVFACDTADYATALGNSITEGTVTVETVTVSGETVTVEFTDSADSITIDMGAKVFVDSLTVYATKAAPVAPSIELTHISLHPGKDALGYKAAATNAPEGAKIQITLWVSESKKVTKANDTVRLVNILANNGGETTIYAKAELLDKDGKLIATSAEAQTTMKKTVELVEAAVEANSNAYSAEQMTAVQALIAKFESKMLGWNIDAIKAWKAPSTEQ